MIQTFKHRNAGDALLAALSKVKSLPDTIVEIIDPSQSGRAVVERVPFITKGLAKQYIKDQKKIDHWNRYEIAPTK